MQPSDRSPSTPKPLSQASGFYERLGYLVFGAIADYRRKVTREVVQRAAPYGLDRISPFAERALNKTEELEMKFAAIITLFPLLLTGSALAEDNAMRARLMGKWQQSDGNGAARATWTLKDMGDSIHVSNSSDTQTVEEFDCNTVGKECAIKHGGHSSKVSMWFNGAKLVELETTGSQVVKRLFAVTGDGDTMELETIPIAPSASSETTHFKRAPASVSKQ